MKGPWITSYVIGELVRDEVLVTSRAHTIGFEKLPSRGEVKHRPKARARLAQRLVYSIKSKKFWTRYRPGLFCRLGRLRG
ncbi:MAG: hypothetical protein ACI9TH_000171 [Kiritimatiellia bacterium]|jgi:hypothetical protein